MSFLILSTPSTTLTAAFQAPAPSAPNESAVIADVLDVAVIPASSVGIRPEQPLCVLTLRLRSVTPVPGMLDALAGRAGQTVRAYSKDVTLAALSGKRVTGTLTLDGDERSGRLWVRTLSASREGSR
ncbi:MAG TPA: hypothetical protein VGU22_08010 [Methylomirabilota bacterium]|jgi:hypothetical protein|nr:hypothetical protein [Methylomirabilota bacterium]